MTTPPPPAPGRGGSIEVRHPGLDFAERLKHAGFKQKAIAEQIELAPTHLNEFLKGKRFLPAIACARLQVSMGIGRELWRKQGEYEYYLACSTIVASRLPLSPAPAAPEAAEGRRERG